MKFFVAVCSSLLIFGCAQAPSKTQPNQNSVYNPEFGFRTSAGSPQIDVAEGVVIYPAAQKSADLVDPLLEELSNQIKSKGGHAYLLKDRIDPLTVGFKEKSKALFDQYQARYILLYSVSASEFRTQNQFWGYEIETTYSISFLMLDRLSSVCIWEGTHQVSFKNNVEKTGPFKQIAQMLAAKILGTAGK